MNFGTTGDFEVSLTAWTTFQGVRMLCDHRVSCVYIYRRMIRENVLSFNLIFVDGPAPSIRFHAFQWKVDNNGALLRKIGLGKGHVS